MKKIIVGERQIEVEACYAFVKDYGRGEKVLLIKASKEKISLAELGEILDGDTSQIDYYEDDKLMCCYVGYDSYEVLLRDGTYSIEMHKAGLDDRMDALLVNNERLSAYAGEIKTENLNLAKAVVAVKEENQEIKKQFEEGGEANKIINTMLGLEE